MDFIRSYENALSEETLTNLIMLATNQITWKSNRHPNRSDKQLAIEPFWPDLAGDINNRLLNFFDAYVTDFPYLKQQGEDWMSGQFILQKTEPMEGYHVFHAENSNYNNAVRMLAWMIYLNNVSDGGETYFPTQKRKLKPKEGDLYIWPAYFTHPHKG